MAVQTKAQLHTAIASLPSPVTVASLQTLLDDVVDSYEDLIAQYTTVQRDSLTPFEGLKIYNTTSNRLEYFSSAEWLPCSQKEVVAVDCSANPNYQEGLVGDQYIVSVAGLIGGASGKPVYVGDIVYCIADNAGGAEGSVGTSWAVCHSNSATDSPMLYSEISLSSAEILALNATPKQLVAAPGSGKVIVPMQFVTNFIWDSIAYATNTGMYVRTPTGTGVSLVAIDKVASEVQAGVISYTKYTINEKLEVYINSGNPTAGNSTMTVGVYYKIHTI